ncbi:MAG: peptide deformylase [Myxococcota bacterium]
MALLTIIEAPHPVLTKPARDVTGEEFGEALDAHLSDMAETMYAAPGVGLAAPQVGDGRRLVVIDSGNGGHDGAGLLKLVNPRIVERSVENISWAETCLSVPEFEVSVTRTERLRLQWQTPYGEAQERWFEGYEAVIVQHELDHLEGTTLLDKVSNFRRGRYLRKRRKAVRV